MKYLSALSLAPVFMASADALLHLGIDFELPLGISLPINVDVGPTSSPPEGCTSVWHPPHNGVDMDGCDNDDDDHWHYVHPGQPSYPSQPPHVWTTKTVTATHVSTVLSCAPEVTDCPYRHPTVTTVVVPETTTICPVAVTTGYEAPPTSEAYLPPPVATSTSEGYLPPAETTWTAATTTTTPCEEEVTSTTTPCEETVTPTTTPCEETETYVESTSCEETVTPTTPCEETETYVVESTPCEETVPAVTTPCEESKTWVTKVSESTPCETPVWTTPMATPVYPPPAGYTTTPAAGSPGYCPGPGCPSPTNAVGTVTHPAYATPTASVVQVTGGAAQNGHTVGGFVAVAAALLAALL